MSEHPSWSSAQGSSELIGLSLDLVAPSHHRSRDPDNVCGLVRNGTFSASPSGQPVEVDQTPPEGVAGVPASCG